MEDKYWKIGRYKLSKDVKRTLTNRIFQLAYFGLLFVSLNCFSQDAADKSGNPIRFYGEDSCETGDLGIAQFRSHAVVTLKPQELPIKPTRTIGFTTDEGSNMDVNVSPDGRTLLFDLLGDLYTLPAGGGLATQITRGMAINCQPAWSPDGKRIAYISDVTGSQRLHVRDIAGKFHVVLGPALGGLNDTGPLWMPGGNYLVKGDKIYGVAGGTMTQGTIVNHPIQFSADGQLVYYVDSMSLFRYDRQSKVTQKLTGLKEYESAILSQDGRWWAYVADSNSKKCLIVKNIVTNTERMLVPSLVLKWCFYHWPLNSRYCFSPDSRGIFIGYGGKIHRIDIGDGVDKIIPFKANVKVDLGPFNYNTFRVRQDSVKVRYTRSANKSPDGKHLVFSALDQVYVMDLPRGKPRLLCPQLISQYQPVYSPDGRWIAYVSWCDTVGGYLWRVQSTGGQPVRLTRLAGEYQRPSWSPNGKLIAVIKGGPAGYHKDQLYASGKGDPTLGERDNPGIGQLQIVSVNDGMVKCIADSIPLWNQLTFSPDGARIMYAPHRMEENDHWYPIMMSKDLEGNNQQILVLYRSEELDQNWIRQRSVSPDGRFIVYSAGEDLYLAITNYLGAPSVIDYTKQDVSTIRFARGVDPVWEKGGHQLGWTYGDRYYSIDLQKVVIAAQERKSLGLSDSSFVTVNAKPDQTISMDITVPGFYAKGRLALRNVRIITMQGNKVIEHGTILIKDGRFTSVGSVGMVSIPAGTKILDLTGTTIMPGFVDLHLHMPAPEDIFPQQSWMHMVNLAYGVTTARDPRTNVDDFGYMELLAAGRMTGPRLYPSGRSVSQGGNLDDMAEIDDLEEAKRIVSKRALLGGTFIKQYLLPTRLQREWLLIAAREEGMNMTNEGDFLPLPDVGMIKDGSTGVEHNPIWGDTFKDIFTFIAQSGTYFTPTLQVHKGEGNDVLKYMNYLYWRNSNLKLMRFMPHDPRLQSILETPPIDSNDLCYVYPSHIDAQIRKAGARVTLGSHGNNEGIGVHNELWALQMGGLSNMEALQAATIMGAQAIGIQQDIGSIEIGKIADLIILNKNPLDDIHNSREIRYVMKDGILYDGDTLDEIWPVVKKCPEWRLKNDSSVHSQ